MSKENFTKFKCDSCMKSITLKYNIGYPYEKGWKYLFNFDFKDEPVRQNRVMDKHFCCAACMVAFIEKLIDRAVEDFL